MEGESEDKAKDDDIDITTPSTSREDSEERKAETAEPFIQTTRESTPSVDAAEDEERICRFCFGEEEDGAEGSLISPCNCTGGQKWVHLNCLRKWQRSVLVTQPTHPMFYEDDVRQHKCNVCTGQFTCDPPTRHELMQGFTGAELAALLESGCLITAHPQFSRDLSRQLVRFSPETIDASDYLHWKDSTYLISEIDDEPEHIRFRVSSDMAKVTLIQQLMENSCLKIMGKRFVIVREGPLEGGDLFESIRSLPIGSVVSLAASRTEPGQETIVAVNLTRPMEVVPLFLKRTSELAYSRHRVHLVHFVGGPCQEKESICVLPRPYGPVSEKWMVSPSGEWMWTRSLKAALETFPVHARPNKRPRSDSDEPASPDEPIEGKVLPILSVYWGDARWSRTQLLGELAKGSWGMCRGVSSDVLPSKDITLCDFLRQRRELTKRNVAAERLFYAPVSEMTEHVPSPPMSEEEEQVVEARLQAYRQRREQRELMNCLDARWQEDQIRARPSLRDLDSVVQGLAASVAPSSPAVSWSESSDDSGSEAFDSDDSMDRVGPIGQFIMSDSDDAEICAECVDGGLHSDHAVPCDGDCARETSDHSDSPVSEPLAAAGTPLDVFFDMLSSDDANASQVGLHDDMELVSCESDNADVDFTS